MEIYCHCSLKFQSRHRYFPNEDALLGSLMHRIGVQPTDNTKFLPLIYCSNPERTRLVANICALSKQIVLHGVKERQQLRMHFSSAVFNNLAPFCLAFESNYDYGEIRDRCERENE